MKDAPVTHMYKTVSKTHTLHQVTNIQTGVVVSERMSWSEADSDRKVANKAYFAGWIDGGRETCVDCPEGFGELHKKLTELAELQSKDGQEEVA